LNQFNPELKPPIHPSQMKFQNLRFPLWRTLLATACLSALAVSAQAQTLLVSSFEGPEFVAGQTVNGVDGWTASTSGANMPTPSTAFAYSGTQSLAVRNNSGTSSVFFAYSPNIWADTTTSVSFFLNTQGTVFSGSTTIARWEVAYANVAGTTIANSNRFVMQLQYGATAADDYQIRFYSATATNVIAGGSFDLVGSAGNLDPSTWNEVIISLDLSTTTERVSVSVGGYSTTGVALAASLASPDTRFAYFRVGTNETGSGISYYDYVTIPVPEPSAALLALGGLCGFAIRRNRRSS
jgi:hypothetical protein